MDSGSESSLDQETEGISLKTGFDCKFVEPPPKLFVQAELKCPVCLQIIRDPQQVTCCGKNFCESCIICVSVDEGLPCPACEADDYEYYPDAKLRQSLYALKVCCSHKSEGCEWTGELGQLDEHLNTDPKPEKRLQGCPLTIISYDFHHVGCPVKLPRKEMPGHLKENLLTHISALATC